ncbi:hypothetical protein NDU88_006840 [Pleurodeles waltl]|uniref:Uncharacterized protein n=1 Tax=Pleurodeles waltl TaxID=8319 RepID=A0AAV7SR22_PLEWA|nr:hypothetical protein NDU88_006840 [Pleurodeles waltl]
MQGGQAVSAAATSSAASWVAQSSRGVHRPPIQARPGRSLQPCAARRLSRLSAWPVQGHPQTQGAPRTPRCCSPTPAHGPAHRRGSGAPPLCFAWVWAAEPRRDAPLTPPS